HWPVGDGAWRSNSHPLMITSLAMARLGYLGLGPGHEALSRAAEFLFSKQRKDGGWPLFRAVDDVEGVTESPLQTSMVLRGLAYAGFATDPRSERAYEWLLGQRLDDGAWPTGKTRGNFRRVAGYRRLAHSTLGCRTNTTAAVQCLALHPARCASEAARRGLDLLLGRETRDAEALGFEMARLLGAEPARGFVSFFARYDVALILDLCGRIGASVEDERIANLVAFVTEARNAYGLWSFAAQPQCDRWVTFDLLRALTRLDHASEWVAMEPRTPFQPYPSRARRY
ncbi:MAG: hypothetical protein P8Y95_13590, partial [Gammaproteobacteria bacterium]